MNSSTTQKEIGENKENKFPVNIIINSSLQLID